MAQAPLHNVSFQAAHTNSAPPSPALPYNIEQGLRGEVGTTRLPASLASVSQFFLYLTAVSQFAGILWILWKWPFIAALLAVCVAGISLSLAGLFHSLPYLDVRRNLWSEDNKRLLWGCSVISWAAWVAITYFLIFYQPVIPELKFPKLSFPKPQNRAMERVRSNLELASNRCVYEGDRDYCRWRKQLSTQLASMKREAEFAKGREAEELPQKETKTEPQTDEDYWMKIAIWLSASMVLGAITRLVTCGSPFGSEANNAIWREPHGGYTNNPTAASPGGNPDAAMFKKKGFDRWLKNNVSLTGDASIPVDGVYDDYKKSLEKHVIPPPAYNQPEFKVAFKSVTGKDTVEVKGITSYQGIALSSGGLI